MSIKLEPVQSSNLAAIGYDAAGALLIVVFSNGAKWKYEGVPAEVHQALMNAESKGRFFHTDIKPKYSATQYVDQAAEVAAASTDQVVDAQAPAEDSISGEEVALQGSTETTTG